MILVTRGIIIKDGCVLAAQRPASMSLPFKWELPGGKVEENEDIRICLIRETKEELGLDVEVGSSLEPYDREFKEKHYRMLPFECHVTGGKLEAIEHEQFAWVPFSEIEALDWAPAEGVLMKRWLAKNSAVEVKVAELSLAR